MERFLKYDSNHNFDAKRTEEFINFYLKEKITSTYSVSTYHYDDGSYYAYILDGSTKKYLKIGTSNTSFTLTTTKTAISYDSANGYLYANSRYLATYGTQDMRTYQASNIKGTNLYMVLTPIG